MMHPTDNISNAPVSTEQGQPPQTAALPGEPQATEVPLAPDLRRWGTYTSRAFAHISPLYHHLSQQMADDAEIQALIALVDLDQPTEVTFFTAVNELLYAERGDPLAAYYASLTLKPLPADEAYPAFRAFCLRHEEALRQRLPTMRLQTNEVTRCANLLPAFELVSHRGGRKPLALIEIGCSAGLNLQWDRYRYYYLQRAREDDEQPQVVASLGNPFSTGPIRCTLEGRYLPHLPRSMPAVARRIGIDVAPLDIHRERDVHLLQACIWPEETFRHQLLRDAITLARRGTPPTIITGDASEKLPEVIDALPSDVTICVYHSYALQQGPAQVREQILAYLEQASRARDLYRVSLEIDVARWTRPRLEFFAYHGGRIKRYEHLADCEVHGERMRWVAER